ncbi:MAG TPA: hypothetical protein EYN91_22020 [Candidatus Melainabacteria bacterium]|nr:hypothetical protein [Candidatus Melainabacteria bacterium]
MHLYNLSWFITEKEPLKLISDFSNLASKKNLVDDVYKLIELFNSQSEDLSKEYEGRLKVVKLNTDENPKTAQAYSIRGIPSLYVFKTGQVVEQVVGAVPKSALATAINKHV